MLDHLELALDTQFHDERTSSEGSDKVLSKAGKVLLSLDKIYRQPDSGKDVPSGELSDVTSRAIPMPLYEFRHDHSRIEESRH